MGKGGRLACIATPFVITLAALACLIVIFLAGTIKNNSTLGDLYFIKMNMTDIDLSQAAELVEEATGKNLSNFEAALEAAKQQLQLKDFYTVYLTNYCSWNQGQDPYSNCTSVQRPFAFDPLEAWGLNRVASSMGQNVSSVLPSELRKGIDVYTKLSHAMFYVYCVAAIALALTALVGIAAIFSRWGSFFTAFFAGLSALMTVVTSGIATAMFVTLKGVLTTVLDKPYSTKTDLGSRIYALTWICAGLALAASVFWTASICCCSGRSPYNPGSKDARRTRAEKTPYTYERVGSPFLGQTTPYAQQGQSMPMNPINNYAANNYPANNYQQPGYSQQRASAYEPFRPSHT